ncbi:MAG TPA: DUF1634 domain-containing protein [Candidatus Limnocylindrales bacterium]|nr:DUF1634 domain-containing protein [Candidatus Limnocylindrales bacterium]
MTAATRGRDRDPEEAGFEAAVGRIVTIGTTISVVLIGIGVALMVVNSRSPLDPSPPFSFRAIAGDIVAGRARGFLWLGLLAAVATPPARVVGSLVGYLRQGERTMAIVAVGILAVIAGGVALALLTGTGLR